MHKEDIKTRLGVYGDNETVNKLYKSLQLDEIEAVQWYCYELKDTKSQSKGNDE